MVLGPLRQAAALTWSVATMPARIASEAFTAEDSAPDDAAPTSATPPGDAATGEVAAEHATTLLTSANGTRADVDGNGHGRLHVGPLDLDLSTLFEGGPLADLHLDNPFADVHLDDVRQFFEEGAERVGDLVEEGVELVGDAFDEGVELVGDAFGSHRRVWEDGHHEHAQIEVHGLEDPSAVGFRRRIAQALSRLDDVRWAEVNAITGRVAVAFDGGQPTLGTLLDVIESLEDAHGMRHGETPRPGWDCSDRAEHPADDEPVHRVLAIMAGDLLSIGWAVGAKLARFRQLPIEIGGLVTVVDNNPWLRLQAEKILGRRVAALVLPLGSAAAGGLAQGPLGAMLDLAHQATVLGEVRARRRVWCQREPEFYAIRSDEPIEPPDLDPRPVPMPDGPVELASKRLGQLSLAGFGGTLLATRDPRRAADAFLVSTPKAARLGREGFAAHLGRTLAYRGIVPLDASALRRLDRVDTVVLDADVVRSPRWEIRGACTPDGRDAPSDVVHHAERLLDADDVDADRTADGWRLAPVKLVADGGQVALPRGTRARAREITARGGRALALVNDGQVAAVVDAVDQLDPGLDAVVAAVRACGHRLLVAGRAGRVADRIGADGTLPGGRALGEAVRDLQADGAVVMLIGRQGHRGLAAADVGLGVVAPTGRPSWGADLILGRELADAATIVEATAVAREVSRRSARFAVGGSALGALVAGTGPRAAAGSRGLAMVNGAAAAALASGTWAAVRLAHRPRPYVPDRVRWHVLSADRAVELLDTDAQRGLTVDEARQRRTVSTIGGAEVSPGEPFLAELANPLNPILGVGAGLSAAVGSMTDAGMVLGLIGINSLVGGLQRLRADRTVRGLLERDVEEVTVVRDGREQRVREDRLVRGDVIVLHAGDAVPADARILVSDGCEVDESSLTGESLPVAKTADPCPEAAIGDRACMLYEDTTISSGSVRAVVVATGEHTEVARSLALAGPPPPTGVELRLEELTKRLLPAALATAGGTAGVGLLRRWPLRDVASTAVSLAIASVPEGLPFVATAGQLAGARRLAANNAVVRNPRTVEALGRVDVLCVDKTGTLTEGRVRLTGVSDGRRNVHRREHDDPLLRRVLAAGLRASAPADAEANGNGLDETDEALHRAAEALDVTAADGLPGWTVVTELPFDSNRGVHAVLGRARRRHHLVVKGAPEVVLEACTTWRNEGGDDVELDEASRSQVLEQIGTLARRGHRLLAVAERDASSRPELEEDRLERLRLIGLIALSDPVRETAAEAVRGIGEAGVRTIMVTGDHPDTALHIASELGLDGERALTGTDLDDLDDEQLADALQDVAVVARVSPAHKLRVVKALQARGHVVAMTGDGANDAAAIRLAEVGVALGERSSPAARDAADIVVTDDRIETLIDAVAEGRALWGSVREALAVLVGGNLGEIGFTALASLFSRAAPLDPRQFLLVNLFTDLAPAVAIAVRPPEDVSTETLLREGPEASLGTALRRDVTIRGTATALGATAAWTAARLTGTRRHASTVGLVALVGTQLGQTVAAGGWKRPTTLLTGLGSAAGLAAIVQTPGVSQFFGCRPLGPLGWSQATTAAAIATAGSQLASRIAERADLHPDGAAVPETP
ncbi:HAD-IC family P-type ATPase [Egicoccus sp. AB-alg2]|uniref:cation-translocating P-type ATPase n=1 Tax=Egicoccus sp. AB-alg2 TaxID=3242693 RepID=UPI00359D1E12